MATAVGGCGGEKAVDAPGSAAASSSAAHVLAVEVTDTGFKPGEVRARRGEAITLRFTRTGKSDCVAAIKVPWATEKIDLPLGQPVDVAVPASEAKTFQYACWMDMVHGKVVIDD